MDRRFFLALLLSGAVVILTPLIFGRPLRQPVTPLPVVSTANTIPGSAAGSQPPGAAPVTSAPVTSPAATAAIAGETLSLGNALTTLRFSTVGAALHAVDLPRYAQLGGREGTVQLRDAEAPMVRHRLIAGGDTIPVDRTVFGAVREFTANGERLIMTGAVAGGTLSIAYTMTKDNYVTQVEVRAEGFPAPAFLLTDLPSSFVSQEADSAEDYRHFAYALKPAVGGAERVDFRKPDPGERLLQPGPLTWAVAKSKYFLVGVVAPAGAESPFAELQVTGAMRVNRVASRAHATVVSPLGSGVVRYELYAGPQEWERLVAMGRAFENANPYGGFISGIVQPFATIVMRILLWAKRTTALEYGWILVLFGIAIRLLMWPLNSRMLRTSLKMQRLAPAIQAAQAAAKAKHPNDPAAQQQALMKVYNEHGVSPLGQLSGCLPLLLTMPVLFALFFVFQNTIEFRGVSFLWLPDITLMDPYYIVPLAMGGSMYLTMWLGMRNAPPNPQQKMMSWMMPVVMTAVLFKFASGLNLYYTVQNLAALPQQWLIANERGKAGPVATIADGGERKKR